MRDNEQVRQAADGGSSAPQITLPDIEANIVRCHYFTAAEGVLGAYKENGDPPNELSVKSLPLLTFCVLVLRNGFTVTGESACVSPENFDAQVGRDIARKKAVEKIWPLMGYELKSKIAE